MKTIPLTRDMVTIVSDEDYDSLSRYKWHAGRTSSAFYATRCENRNGKKLHIRMHRQLVADAFAVDHINGNTLDNRRENLRPASAINNSWNMKSKGGASRWKGVFWSTGGKSWSIQIRIFGKRRSVHGIEDERIASLIYDLMSHDRSREFSRFNNPEIMALMLTAIHEGKQ